MILIVDSGSTKTEWIAVDEGKIVVRTKSAGINPVYQAFDEIRQSIADNVAPAFAGIAFDEVHYYGAGCIPEKIEGMISAISFSFPAPVVTVQSDMVGAARALCGRKPGIACILGTGGNTCFWDGESVAKNVPALGFILGDEGSGAVLGRTLVADILKGQTSERVAKKFLQSTGLTVGEIINRVYKQPYPNRFLASFTRFMNENRDEAEIEAIIIRCFTQFFERNILQYDYTNYPVNIIGSVGFYFRDMLETAAKPFGIKLGTIEQSPLEGLVRYHSK